MRYSLRWAFIGTLTFLCLSLASAVAPTNDVDQDSTNGLSAINDKTTIRAKKPYTIKEGELIFLLHGIGKGAYDMAPLAKRLNNAGYAVLNFEYPSTDFPICDLADKLAEEVKRFPDYKIHFVTHSMGGIVVRTYLSAHDPENLGRLVMIAPPSKGAELAQFFGDWSIYKFMLGPAGQELKPGEAGSCVAAGIPTCEFGIIAGGVGRPIGINPLLPGDNDGTVTVESTKLEGSQDFTLVPYPHPVIQMMPRTAELTLNFLETGQFKPEQIIP